jgi:hypothetical protein
MIEAKVGINSESVDKVTTSLTAPFDLALPWHWK